MAVNLYQKKKKKKKKKTVAENCLKWGNRWNKYIGGVEAQGQDLDKLNSEWDREWNTNYTDYAEKSSNVGFNMDKAKEKNALFNRSFSCQLNP